MLGSKVDIDHSRQRQIGEKRPQSEDRDWSCFKVELSLYTVHVHAEDFHNFMNTCTLLDRLQCTFTSVHVQTISECNLHCLHVLDVPFL